MKKILQLGGGQLQLHSVRQLEQAGYEMYIADKNPDCPGAHAFKNFSAIDIADPIKISEHVKAKKIDAVIAVNDAGVYPAAYASEMNGLRYISTASAIMATNKGEMRKAWKEAGLSQPEFLVVNNAARIKDAVEKIGFPCILKPALNWGSRGISALYNESDLDFAVSFAQANDRNSEYIIESLVPGTEMTVEGLCRQGELTILSRSDKVHQQHEKFKVSMQLNYPSSFSESILAKVDRLVTEAAKALGLTNCAIHCELIVNDGQPFLVEMAARPGGGHIFGMIVEAQSGVPMPLALTKILLNEEFDIRPRFSKGVTYRFFAPPAGIFQSVEGIEELAVAEGVLDIGFNLPPGTKVGAIAGDVDRPGFLVLTAGTQEEVIRKADTLLTKLTYRMQGEPVA